MLKSISFANFSKISFSHLKNLSMLKSGNQTVQTFDSFSHLKNLSMLK